MGGEDSRIRGVDGESSEPGFLCRVSLLVSRVEEVRDASAHWIRDRRREDDEVDRGAEAHQGGGSLSQDDDENLSLSLNYTNSSPLPAWKKSMKSSPSRPCPVWGPRQNRS